MTGVTKTTEMVSLYVMACSVKKTLHGISLTGTSGKVCLSSGFPSFQYTKLERSTSSGVEEAEAESQSQSGVKAPAKHPICHHIAV